jgi:hypothetical protein
MRMALGGLSGFVVVGVLDGCPGISIGMFGMRVM